MTAHRFVAILMLIPLLAGCGGILSAVPERQIYRTSPTPVFAAPLPRSAAQMSVSREAKAAATALPEIVRAFDSALGGAVEEIVTWTLRNPALSERRRSVISRTRFVHAIGGGGS